MRDEDLLLDGLHRPTLDTKTTAEVGERRADMETRVADRQFFWPVLTTTVASILMFAAGSALMVWLVHVLVEQKLLKEAAGALCYSIPILVAASAGIPSAISALKRGRSE